MANRRASSVVFGFDFQVNAAIILMLENISDLKSLRLEGDYEDIDLTLSNNHHILKIVEHKIANLIAKVIDPVQIRASLVKQQSEKLI